jgi:hypothetical protein
MEFDPIGNGSDLELEWKRRTGHDPETKSKRAQQKAEQELQQETAQGITGSTSWTRSARRIVASTPSPPFCSYGINSFFAHFFCE